ncbi:hypothetical protein [Halomicrococcus sp. SG-WS-1]|uniref:hypothetical protein n=1 Tax=Halomicrococcus sp. SG-WS-1 TaxID=3439057 RepID=UPI003F7AE015
MVLNEMEEDSKDNQQRKTETVGVLLEPTEHQQLVQEAEEYGVGKGPLLRKLARRVRKIGDGDLVDGMALLRLQYKDEIELNSTDED